MRRLPVTVLLVVMLGLASSVFAAGADTTPQSLPFGQDWTNQGMITTDDIWSGVPGVVGYRGDDLTGVNDTDPQTILADGAFTPVDVIANQTNPNTLAMGGVAEFGLPHLTAALQGSGTADAPHLVLSLNTSGRTGITVAYTLRDIDGSVDDAVERVALQYRVGGFGDFTNVPAGFVADATTGPSAAGLATPVEADLPVAADNQPLIQVRIITTNASSNDEWVGVDDLVVASGAADFFSASLNGAQEVPPVATSATGTGTVELSPDETVIRFMVTFTGLTSTAVDAHIHQAPPGEDGGVIFPLPFPSATSTAVPISWGYAVTPAQVLQLRAGNWYFNIHTSAFPDGEIRGQILPTTDPPTKIGVFRPSSSATWLLAGGPSIVWGTSGDVTVPGDYNGDGHGEAALFRPSSGTWFIFTFYEGGASTNWGTSGDIPVPADYDGNGTTDLAVFRPSTNTWYVQGGITTTWGTSGDIPVPADYDGDGSADVAVFRPSTGTWYVQGGLTMAWGTSGDIPVPGDYNDNGSDNVAVFRPSTGVWYVDIGFTTPWGTAGDIPVPGDYNGDGSHTVAVFRPSTAVWYVQGGATATWGTSGDQPLPLPTAIRQAFF